MKSGCAELWDALGSARAAEQDQEREAACALEIIMGWFCTQDTAGVTPGAALGRAVLAPLISCPISATPGVCSLGENTPGGLRKMLLEGWGRTAGGSGAALFLSHISRCCFEPEERFPNQKNPRNSRGFGEI